MKMAEDLVNNVGELVGVHPITKLITCIIKAVSTARRVNRHCRESEQWLEAIEGLVKPLLNIPMEHTATSKPLKLLEESLKKAYEVVIKYKDRSYPYRFIMGANIVKRIRDAREGVQHYIDIIPLIKLFVSETIVPRVDTRCQDKEEEEDRKKGKKKKNREKDEGRDNREKNKENEKVKGKGRGKGKVTENEEEPRRVREKDTKNEEEPRRVREKDTKEQDEKKKLRDTEKVKGNGRGKGKDTEDEEPRRVREKKGEEHDEKKKARDREKYTEKEIRNKEKEKEKGKRDGREEEDQKKNVVETAVLKVSMHCECNGCPDGIKRSIHNYPGVNKVTMEMDMRILSVTVVGHFDAKMLRDYVAEKNKKEVELVGNGVWESEDHLEKTGKGSNSISGGGKPKGGNKKKKRVVPMVAASVVLKVGGTGLRCGCNGCVDKICNRLFKIRGVQQVGVDTDKDQVTVTGTTMDMETLLETLGNKVRRPVEVVQPGMMDRKDY